MGSACKLTLTIKNTLLLLYLIRLEFGVFKFLQLFYAVVMNILVKLNNIKK